MKLPCLSYPSLVVRIEEAVGEVPCLGEEDRVLLVAEFVRGEQAPCPARSVGG